MLLYMCQVFSSLLCHLQFFVHFFVTFMVYFFIDHPISLKSISELQFTLYISLPFFVGPHQICNAIMESYFLKS